MKEGQKYIYYLGEDDKATLLASPLVGKFQDKGFQVILADDPLDETLFNALRKYKKYKIINIARSDSKKANNPRKVNDKHFDILEPASTKAEIKPPERAEVEHIANIDAENRKVAGGLESEEGLETLELQRLLQGNHKQQAAEL